MDIFGAALQPILALAPSQERTSVVVDDISDDDDDGGGGGAESTALAAGPVCIASQNNGANGGNQEETGKSDDPHVKPSKRARAWPLGKLPKTTALTAEPGDGVICIFVGIGKKRRPVPMWPQYTVDWNGVDFGSGNFIVISNYETWMLSVVDAVTVYGSGQKARNVAKTCMERVRREWQAYLDQARSPKKLDDPWAGPEDDSMVSVSAPRKRRCYRDDGHPQCAEISVDIGGNKVQCLNEARRMVMRADGATMKCIVEWMVPIIVYEAHLVDEQCAESPGDGVPPTGFQFVGNPTPNLREKVCWNPSHHTWEVILKNALGRVRQDLRVDSALFRDEYEAKKLELYSAAILAWNELDGSTRHRIPVK